MTCKSTVSYLIGEHVEVYPVEIPLTVESDATLSVRIGIDTKNAPPYSQRSNEFSTEMSSSDSKTKTDWSVMDRNDAQRYKDQVLEQTESFKVMTTTLNEELNTMEIDNTPATINRRDAHTIVNSGHPTRPADDVSHRKRTFSESHQSLQSNPHESTTKSPSTPRQAPETSQYHYDNLSPHERSQLAELSQELRSFDNRFKKYDIECVFRLLSRQQLLLPDPQLIQSIAESNIITRDARLEKLPGHLRHKIISMRHKWNERLAIDMFLSLSEQQQKRITVDELDFLLHQWNRRPCLLHSVTPPHDAAGHSSHPGRRAPAAEVCRGAHSCNAGADGKTQTARRAVRDMDSCEAKVLVPVNVKSSGAAGVSVDIDTYFSRAHEDMPANNPHLLPPPSPDNLDDGSRFIAPVEQVTSVLAVSARTAEKLLALHRTVERAMEIFYGLSDDEQERFISEADNEITTAVSSSTVERNWRRQENLTKLESYREYMPLLRGQATETLVMQLVNDLHFDFDFDVVEVVTTRHVSNVYAFIRFWRATEMVVDSGLTEDIVVERNAAHDKQLVALYVELISRGFDRREVLDAIAFDRCTSVEDAEDVLTIDMKYQFEPVTTSQDSTPNQSRVYCNVMDSSENYLPHTNFALKNVLGFQTSERGAVYFLPDPSTWHSLGRSALIRTLTKKPFDLKEFSLEQRSTRELRMMLIRRMTADLEMAGETEE